MKRKNSLDNIAHNSSFRDPKGFIFTNSDGIFRQINPNGQEDFSLLTTSGLYDALIKENLLVSHKIISEDSEKTIIEPQKISTISYPFEWSFSQLRDAALLTLKIQLIAMQHGMSLKDASAYNVQFAAGKPIFIDTLSFEKFTPGKPWHAYRQFCQHFLAPLALMRYTDISLSQLLRVHLDGIPLPLAAKLLPARAKFSPGIAMHVILHGRSQQAKASDHQPKRVSVPQRNLEAILENLQQTIRKLQAPKLATEWGDYYSNTNYSADAADHKAKLIRKLVKPLSVGSALDLGGNNGHYSRVLSKLDIATICSDIDPNAVEANYQTVRAHDEKLILPLLVDLTNPGGNIGWMNRERSALHERVQVDLVMALALIHHLAISNNVPLQKIAEYFAAFGPYLLLEFVPKQDSQVQKLLATREDIFPTYTETGFLQAFEAYYDLVEQAKIPDTSRTLFLMKRK